MLRTAFNSGWLNTARKATEMDFPFFLGNDLHQNPALEVSPRTEVLSLSDICSSVAFCPSCFGVSYCLVTLYRLRGAELLLYALCC